MKMMFSAIFLCILFLCFFIMTIVTVGDLFFYGRPFTFFPRSGVVIKKYTIPKETTPGEKIVLNHRNQLLLYHDYQKKHGMFVVIKTIWPWPIEVVLQDKDLYNRIKVGETITWEKK